jgi:predicted nucleic acid-binding protein
MATKSAERALLDTNVLVDATDTKRARHQAALAVLETRSGLLINAQIAREYLVMATRPASSNGLGLDLEDALMNLGEFRRVARMLSETKPLLPALIKLLGEVPCEGKMIHDALIVASMGVHRVTTLITSNASDFTRFGRFIRVLEPAKL